MGSCSRHEGRRVGAGMKPGMKTQHDSILALMRTHRIPMTRENYLALAYLGHPPAELDPEEEAELPETFQEQYPTVENVVLDSPWGIQ